MNAGANLVAVSVLWRIVHNGNKVVPFARPLLGKDIKVGGKFSILALIGSPTERQAATATRNAKPLKLNKALLHANVLSLYVANKIRLITVSNHGKNRVVHGAKLFQHRFSRLRFTKFCKVTRKQNSVRLFKLALQLSKMFQITVNIA